MIQLTFEQISRLPKSTGLGLVTTLVDLVQAGERGGGPAGANLLGRLSHNGASKAQGPAVEGWYHGMRQEEGFTPRVLSLRGENARFSRGPPKRDFLELFATRREPRRGCRCSLSGSSFVNSPLPPHRTIKAAQTIPKVNQANPMTIKEGNQQAKPTQSNTDQSLK